MRLHSYWFVAVLPTFAACSCDETPFTSIPDASFSLDSGQLADSGPAADAQVPLADAALPDAMEPEGRVLTFNGTPPVTDYYGAAIDLHFTLKTVSGAAVSGETIRFSFAGTGGTLGASSVSTDPSGGGVVRFTAGNTNGQGTLTASADRASDLNLPITVEEDPAATLMVQVSTRARIGVASSDAFIYVGAAGAIPSCAQLLSATRPVPTLGATLPSPFPASQSFNNLMSGAMVTVLATGSSTHGVIVARGCTEGVRLAGGAVTQIAVTLDQLPTDLSGDYDVLLQLDLGQALPPPYDTTIGTVTDVLSDPAGWAVYQTLAGLDAQSGTVFVTWTPPGATMERLATFTEVEANSGVFNVWRTARSALDGVLASSLGQAYVDLTRVGGDIAHLIRRFEVGAHYTLTATGTPDRFSVDESWRALVFEWRLGCPAGDLGCARRPIALSGAHANLAPAEAHYGATAAHAPLPAPGESERFALRLDPHAVDLRYGALILAVLDEIVFPSLPPPLSGQSLSEVLTNVVGCTAVGTSLGSATGLPAALFENLCDQVVGDAAMLLENQLLAIDSSSTPGLSPSGAGQMVLVDGDHDLVTELVPSVSATVAWTSGSANLMPIDGHGRRAASGCVADAECSAGSSCVPIGSYLEVRAVEGDCRRAIGAMAGTAACAADADCASDRCIDPGNHPKVCFSGCSSAQPCQSGSCVADAAAIDLDGMRLGLGTTHVAACVP